MIVAPAWRTTRAGPVADADRIGCVGGNIDTREGRAPGRGGITLSLSAAGGRFVRGMPRNVTVPPLDVGIGPSGAGVGGVHRFVGGAA
jgi:hypothetical protein